jgi:predicted O-linked N-acetylglucosamine transferase (SPINDLY family)
MDYILADSVIIPPGHEKFHAEKVIRLPHTYQSTDNGCTISDRHFTRSEQGLPPDGFVFSCFNGNAKIAPAEFDIWMRLLRGVAGSVLWLIDGGPDATANLRREAAARGVDPDRLVFAKRLPRDQHLARHRCADLFLDTFIYNAHTTATDALWSELPLVTKTGSGFAARVAASLLRAIGMPELVTASAEEYEQLALGLAADRTRLAAIKAKLAANRLTTPLFDTDGFTRALERAYDLAYDRCAAGLTPDHIDVG